MPASCRSWFARRSPRTNRFRPIPPAHDALSQATAAAAKPPIAGPVSTVPAAAAAISGRVYRFPVNASRIDSLALTFGAATVRHDVDLTYYGHHCSSRSDSMASTESDRTGRSVFRPGLPAGGRLTISSCWISTSSPTSTTTPWPSGSRRSRRFEVTANEASGLIRNGHLVGTLATQVVAPTLVRRPIHIDIDLARTIPEHVLRALDLGRPSGGSGLLTARTK